MGSAGGVSPIARAVVEQGLVNELLQFRDPRRNNANSFFFLTGVSWAGRLVWSAVLRSQISPIISLPMCTALCVATAPAAPELMPTT